MDNMTSRQRSRTMSKIRAAETNPEKKLRSALHKKGLRFKKNVKELPGKPDIVLPKYKTVIFVNGCFWHQHQQCSKAVFPKTNLDYWREKIASNVKRDRKNIGCLISGGWKVITVWECEIKNDINQVAKNIAEELL